MPPNEGFPQTSQEIPHDEHLTPEQIGAEILRKLGVGYEVSGILLIGPRPECNGSVAKAVGMSDSHSAMKDSIIREAQQAIDRKESPSEAIIKAINIITLRDKDGNVVRIAESELKNDTFPETPAKLDCLKPEKKTIIEPEITKQTPDKAKKLISKSEVNDSDQARIESPLTIEKPPNQQVIGQKTNEVDANNINKPQLKIDSLSQLNIETVPVQEKIDVKDSPSYLAQAGGQELNRQQPLQPTVY